MRGQAFVSAPESLLGFSCLLGHLSQSSSFEYLLFCFQSSFLQMHTPAGKGNSYGAWVPVTHD